MWFWKKDPLAELKALASQCQSVLGPDLLGAFAHGANQWSLLVADDTEEACLARLAPIFAKDEDLPLPNFWLSKASLPRLHSVRPMDLLAISRAHTVLLGEVPLVGYEPVLFALKAQVKREAQDRLAQFRNSLLLPSPSKKILAAELAALPASLLPMLAGTVYLWKQEYLADYATAAAAVDTAVGGHCAFRVLESSKPDAEAGFLFHSLRRSLEAYILALDVNEVGA